MNATAVTYIHERVKGCCSCPFAQFEFDEPAGYYCGHPQVDWRDISIAYDRLGAPSDCPLRKTAVIIRLETA